MRPDIFRMALISASEGMIKEASVLNMAGRGIHALWRGARGTAGFAGRATGVTPLYQGIRGAQRVGAARMGQVQPITQGAHKYLEGVGNLAAKSRATGIRRLTGTAIGTGVVAAGVSGARTAKKTQSVRQQRYGNIDPRFRRPNPAKGHSQTGLY